MLGVVASLCLVNSDFVLADTPLDLDGVYTGVYVFSGNTDFAVTSMNLHGELYTLEMVMVSVDFVVDMHVVGGGHRQHR